MAFQPDPALPGFYFPSSAPRVADHVYATDGTDENPTGSHLYEFNVGDYAYPAYTPIPHVEMTIFALDDETVSITVYRIAKGRTMPVRGQVGVLATSAGVNVVDWEAPFGIPLTYNVEQFDADGNSLGYTQPFTTQLDVAETWIHNVFDPANGVQVTMGGAAAASLPRPIPTDVHYASGSGLAVAINGQRRGLTDVPVPFLTHTDIAYDKVEAMFGDPYTGPTVPPILCMRTGARQARMRLPQPFFALIAEPKPQPLDASATDPGLILWDCTATEVAPPAVVLVTSVLTYEDIDAAYPTYAAMDAPYGTYLERDRDYSLAGRADDNPGTPGTPGGGTTTELYGEGIYGDGIFGS